MLQNYLKIAIRNLWRNKLYSALNIGGLATGLAAAMLIFLFVSHEFSYDQFHQKADRIYRILSITKYGEQTVQTTAMNAKLGEMLKQNNPEIKDFVRISKIDNPTFKNGSHPEIKFKEEKLAFADPAFFNIFSFKTLEGNFNTALKNPFSLVLSEKVAKKYFGNENPIGKTLLLEGKKPFIVTGVFAQMPSNSTFQFEVITSMATYPKLDEERQYIWEKAGSFETFILLNQQASVAKVEKSIAQVGKLTGFFDETSKYSLEQFDKIHNGSSFSGHQNTKFAYIFSGVAILILILALFNYMSLTTARATIRAKEVGVRKVVGAERLGLVKQFYIEAFVYCFFSFVLAFLMLELLRQPFYDILGLQVDTVFMQSPIFIGIITSIFFLSILLSGSYTSLFLSKFNPIEVLKGKFSSQQNGAVIRKGFLIFQFSVSVVLIICTMVVQKQLDFMRNMDLGLTKDQVLVIPIEESPASKIATLKNDLKQIAGIKNVSHVSTPLYKGVNSWFTKSLVSKKEVTLFSIDSDENFFKTVDLKWKNPPIDSKNLDSKIYLNEIAAEQLELGKNPVGKSVFLFGSKPSIVGGIMKDFHFTGVKSKIEPLMISISAPKATETLYGSIYLRLDSKVDVQAKVAQVQQFYEKYPSEKPFEFYFLDEAFQKTFSDEIRMSKMFFSFTSIAILIACLGLFGLITFLAEQKDKEIGIRKVLGASVKNIVFLLSKDFLGLVLLANFIAIPLAWWAMQKWLQDFVFRISLTSEIFLLASLTSIVLAFVTVSYQAVKSAVANPIKSLRNE